MKDTIKRIFNDEALNKEADIYIKRLTKYHKILGDTGTKTDAELNTRQRTEQGIQIIQQQLAAFIEQNKNNIII